MEAIKCPNCGSEKVQELTEEKYVCLACDNVFLVHNLSKEFRMTDGHIADVHEDLSKKIEGLNKNLENMTIHNNGADVDALFENAFHLLKIEKYDLALEKFTALCVDYSNVFDSWFGKYLAITENGHSVDEKIAYSSEAIECIENMRKCEDYSEEDDNVICGYLESVFKREKSKLEIKLKPLEDRADILKSELNNVERKLDELSKEHTSIKQQEESREARNSILSKIEGGSKLGLIVFSEIKIIKTLFINWLGSSIEIVNGPLPEAGTLAASEAFGSAALNFVAIPFKFIISLGVAIGVPVLIYIILTMIFGGMKSKVPENITKYYEDCENFKLQKKDLGERLKEPTDKKRILEKCLKANEAIDCKDVNSIKRYADSKSSIYWKL